MSDHILQHHVATNLWICGEDLDINLINEKLGFSATTIVRQGEWRETSLEAAKRTYDSRIFLDRWCRSLSGKQSTWNLEKQLEFWLQQLYPVRSAFQEFRALGYWSVIDCQLAALNDKAPSIQFRLTQETQLKLAKLNIDLDFTIYTPIT